MCDFFDDNFVGNEIERRQPAFMPFGCEGRRAWIALRNITHDVREFAAERGVGVEIVVELGIKEKAQEFREKGSEIYKDN